MNRPTIGYINIIDFKKKKKFVVVGKGGGGIDGQYSMLANNWGALVININTFMLRPLVEEKAMAVIHLFVLSRSSGKTS